MDSERKADISRALFEIRLIWAGGLDSTSLERSYNNAHKEKGSTDIRHKKLCCWSLIFITFGGS